MVVFNCATGSPDLLDAELFGHARGAFTGAIGERLGLVRSAEGGTLFLDEIGELTAESQGRLLRLLDSGEVRPVGSDRSLLVNVRIIAATNVNLEMRVHQGKFRRDLFYRLAGVQLILPPLRERPGDVRLLVAHFTQEARKNVRPGFVGFAERALRAMEEYGWPGNIRQLKSEVFRLAALSPDGVQIDSWSPSIQWHGAPPVAPDRMQGLAILHDRERLVRMLKESGGRVRDVERKLGVSHGHLYRVLKRYQILPREFRGPQAG